MTFARGAPTTIDAFERFYVVMSAGSDSVWIVYSEHQLGRSCTHAIQVDSDGTVCDAVEGELADPLSQLPIVNIIPLFAEDGSDIPLLGSFKPPLKLLDTMTIKHTDGRIRMQAYNLLSAHYRPDQSSQSKD